MLEKPCISIRELLSSLKKNRGGKKKKRAEKMQRNIFEQRLQEISPPSPPLFLSVINSPQKKKKKRRRKKKEEENLPRFFPPLNNPAGKTIVYSLSSTFPHNTLDSRVSVARNSHKSRPRFPSAGAEKKSQPPPVSRPLTSHDSSFLFRKIEWTYKQAE